MQGELGSNLMNILPLMNADLYIGNWLSRLSNTLSILSFPEYVL